MDSTNHSANIPDARQVIDRAGEHLVFTDPPEPLGEDESKAARALLGIDREIADAHQEKNERNGMTQ